MTKPTMAPPEHLSEAAKAWWCEIVADFDAEPHHLMTLQAACEAWDAAQAARAIYTADGMSFTDDRGNVRAHPMLAVARDNRVLFARLLRQLDLDRDDEPPAWPAPRPRGLK